MRPVTNQQVFIGTWVTLALLLLSQLVFWFIYNLIAQETFGLHIVSEMLVSILGELLFVLVVSVALDLTYVKPKYLQIVFILTIVLLFIASDGVYIFNSNARSITEVVGGILVLVGLVIADLIIWKRRDEFLD